jgi:GNAT superfamily N-acetyltransferase
MIRDASIADLPQLLELGRQMLAEAPNFQGLPFSARQLEATLTNLIAEPGALVAVAERDGRVVGAVVASAGMHWASEAVIAAELALFVAPDARGGLTAARLIARLKQFAIESGAALCRAGASTGVCTDSVVSLYERQGFKVCGTCLQFDPLEE